MRHLFPWDWIAGLVNRRSRFDGRRAGAAATPLRQQRYPRGSKGRVGATLRETRRMMPGSGLLVPPAFLFAWLGDYIEASVLALALVPSGRGHGCLSAPAHTGYDRGIGRSLGHASARGLRDGGPRDIPSAQLVPGRYGHCQRPGSVFPGRRRAPLLVSTASRRAWR